MSREPSTLAHLRSIHHFLFQDVFPWAGEFRVIDISKGNSNFGRAAFIEAALSELLARLKQEHLLIGMPQGILSFPGRLLLRRNQRQSTPSAKATAALRREFVRQLALHAGHPLSWAGFTQAEMVEASILSHTQGNNSGLAAILTRAIKNAQ